VSKLHASVLLPILSAVVVGVGGFEPPASSLSGMRSNQLSYTPNPLTFRSVASCDHLLFGGADRDRTDDLLNANQALSQLSYSP
jgi:hypothetical protein